MSSLNSKNITLIEPSAELEADFLAMAEEYRTVGDERYAAALEDFSAYLESLSQAARGVNLAPGLVPWNSFWLVLNRRILGCSRLRHRLSPALELEGGHIGYDVRPSERRKGYGTLILALTLQKAKDRGLSRALLTCDTDNLASARIIEKNGGKHSGQAISNKSGKPVSRYWIEL